MEECAKIYSKINQFINSCIDKNKQNVIIDEEESSLNIYNRDKGLNIIYKSALIKNKIHIETTSSEETNSQISLESKENNEINRRKNNIIKSPNEEKNNNNKNIIREESCYDLTKNTLSYEKSVDSALPNNRNLNNENNEQIINIMNDKDRFIKREGKNKFMDKKKSF